MIEILKSIKRRIQRMIQQRRHRQHVLLVQKRKTPKIVVVGYNKTGTTSLNGYFKSVGFLTSPQREFEKMTQLYQSGNWTSIFQAMSEWETFQDSPFATSTPAFIEAIEQRWPDTRFILSVRNNDEEWFRSHKQFHSKLWHGGKEDISWEDIKRVHYISPTFHYEAMKRYVPDESMDPYDMATWKAVYNNHNARMRNHFKGKSNFLEINLAEEGASEKLGSFLGLHEHPPIPHLNKSK